LYFCVLLPRTQGAGTNEDTLIEILITRSNDEIEEIKAIYKEGVYKIYLLFAAFLASVSHANNEP